MPSADEYRGLFERMWRQSSPRGRQNLVNDMAAIGLMVEPNPPALDGPAPALVEAPWFANPPAELLPVRDGEGRIIGNPPSFASENVGPSVVDQVWSVGGDVFATVTGAVDGVATRARVFGMNALILGAFALLAVVVIAARRAGRG